MWLIGSSQSSRKARAGAQAEIWRHEPKQGLCRGAAHWLALCDLLRIPYPGVVPPMVN